MKNQKSAKKNKQNFENSISCAKPENAEISFKLSKKGSK